MESNSLALDFPNTEATNGIRSRPKEINGLLTNGFDDMSSITDEEELEDLQDDITLSDFEGNEENCNTVTLKQLDLTRPNGSSAVHNQLKNRRTSIDLTSTPKQPSIGQNSAVFRSRFQPDNSTIQEGDEFESDYSFAHRVPVNSLKSELINGKRNKRNSPCNSTGSHHHQDKSKEQGSLSNSNNCLSNGNTLSHEHVQILLNNNSKLESELEKFKQEFESLQAISDQQSLRLVEYEGKIRSLQHSLESEKVSNTKLMQNLELSASVTKTLKEQLSDASKSAYLVQIREENEALNRKTKLENQKILQKERAEREVLMNQLEKAKEQLRMEQAKNCELKRELESMQKEKCKPIELNRRYEEHLKTNFQMEYDRNLSEKNEQIFQLEIKIQDLEAENEKYRTEQKNYSNRSEQSSMTGCSPRCKGDVITNLKAQLEKSVDTSKQRRAELISLQDQLLNANQELQKCKQALEQSEKGELEQLGEFISLQEHQSKVDTLQQDIEQLYSRNNDLEQENFELKSSNNELQILLKEISCYKNLGHNDSVKELVDSALGEWKKESVANFTNQIMERARQTRISFFNDLDVEVRKLIDYLNRSVKVDADGYLQIHQPFKLGGSGKNNLEIKLIFRPLRKLWLFFMDTLSEKQKLIRKEADEMQNARLCLEESLNESRSNDISITSDQLGDLRTELNMLKAVNEETKDKFLKYKRICLGMKQKHEKELVSLRRQCSEAIAKHEQIYELKEQEMNHRFKADSSVLQKDLDRKYQDLQQNIQRDMDEFATSQKKKTIFERISRILTDFHEFALDKIRKKDQQFEKFGEISVSFMDPPNNLSKRYINYFQQNQN